MSTNSLKNYIDLEIWQDLEKGIQEIYGNEKITPKRYVALNTCVYTILEPNKPSCLSRLRSNNSMPLRERSPYVYLSLYNKVQKYLYQYLEKIQIDGADLMLDDPLKFYAEEWRKYQLSSKILNGIFVCLNLQWIQREKEQGRKDVYQIYQLALKVWHDTVFEKLNGEVTDAVLKLIESQRKGDEIDTSLISTTIKSYVKLGLIEDEGLLIYKQKFEQKFLDETESFYTKEFDEFASSNLTDKVKYIEQRLIEEKGRAIFYLPNLKTLEDLCEKILVQRPLDLVLDDFQNLQNADDLDDLYESFASNPNSVKKSIENFINRHNS